MNILTKLRDLMLDMCCADVHCENDGAKMADVNFVTPEQSEDAAFNKRLKEYLKVVKEDNVDPHKTLDDVDNYDDLSMDQWEELSEYDYFTDD